MGHNYSELLQWKEALKKAQSILITAHTSPDGDAIGSSLGLSHALTAMGKQCAVVLPNRGAAFLDWMPDIESIAYYEEDSNAVQALVDNSDLIICLDFNALYRLGELCETIENAPQPKVLIDHHIGEVSWPTINLCQIGASSTCELVFDVLNQTERKAVWLSLEAGQCLYTGIMTDTGSFRFHGTSPLVHRVAAELLEVGVKPNQVHEEVDDSFTDGRLKMFAHVLLNNTKYLCDGQVAYSYVSAKEYEDFSVTSSDTEGLVNQPMRLQNVRISVFFKIADDRIKISFRSKGEIDIQQIAVKHFDGGGHRNAAGGISFETWEKTEAKLKTIFQDFPLD